MAWTELGAIIGLCPLFPPPSFSGILPQTRAFTNAPNPWSLPQYDLRSGGKGEKKAASVGARNSARASYAGTIIGNYMVHGPCQSGALARFDLGVVRKYKSEGGEASKVGA